jgi:hypothetical protein
MGVQFFGTVNASITPTSIILTITNGQITNTTMAAAAAPAFVFSSDTDTISGPGNLAVSVSGKLGAANNKLAGGEAFTFSAAATTFTPNKGQPALTTTFTAPGGAKGMPSTNVGVGVGPVVGMYAKPPMNFGTVSTSLSFAGLGPGEFLKLPNSWVITASVPEPASLVMAGAAVLCGVGLWLRRRMAAA